MPSHKHPQASTAEYKVVQRRRLVDLNLVVATGLFFYLFIGERERANLVVQTA